MNDKLNRFLWIGLIYLLMGWNVFADSVELFVSKVSTPSIVVRNGYTLSAAWEMRKIMGKSFWFDIRHMPDLLEKAGLENEPFLKNSLVRFDWYKTFIKSILYGEHEIDSPFIISGSDCYYNEMLELPPSICRQFLEKYKDRFVCFAANECFGNRVEQSRERIGLPDPHTRYETFCIFMACYMDTSNWRNFRSWTMTYPEFRSRTSCGTATYLDHWILEMGAPFTGEEIGNTGYSEHLGMCFAFSRGAARQYGKPWRIYLAVWAPGICGESVSNYCDFLSQECRTYQTGGFSGYDTGPCSGSSLSLQRRQLYNAYMSGTNMIRDENDYSLYIANYDWRTIDKVDPLVKVTRDKPYHLSPAGEIRKELYDNIVKKHDRGTAYTPVALIFDRYHGYIPTYSKNKVLGILPFTEADYMMRAVEATLFPLAIPRNAQSRATSPYGNMFDVLTNNARLETLQAYRVLMLVGDVTLDKSFAERLMQYVENGGTLLINAKQIPEGTLPESFLGCKILKECREGQIAYSLLNGEVINEQKPFTYTRLKLNEAKPLILCTDVDGKKESLVMTNKYGKGHVILTAPDYMMKPGRQDKMLAMFKHLMSHLSNELLPVEWDGHVEVLVNRNNESWVVTLINNEGVTKKGGDKEIVDESKNVDVRLLLKKDAGGANVKEITEWVKGDQLEMVKTEKGRAVLITVPAGDVRILEFKIDY